MAEVYENRKFMIFNTSELSSVDFNEVIESSINTVRKTIDGTKTFVKWTGETIPSTINSLTTKEGPYTYEEIIIILSGSEWNETILP